MKGNVAREEMGGYVQISLMRPGIRGGDVQGKARMKGKLGMGKEIKGKRYKWKSERMEKKK